MVLGSVIRTPLNLQNSPNNMAGMNNPPGTPRDDGEMAGNFLNPFQSESVSVVPPYPYGPPLPSPPQPAAEGCFLPHQCVRLLHPDMRPIGCRASVYLRVIHGDVSVMPQITSAAPCMCEVAVSGVWSRPLCLQFNNQYPLISPPTLSLCSIHPT